MKEIRRSYYLLQNFFGAAMTLPWPDSGFAAALWPCGRLLGFAGRVFCFGLAFGFPATGKFNAGKG